MTGLSAVKMPSKSREVRPCGCSAASWKLHQVHHVHHPDLQPGSAVLEQFGGRDGFHGGHVARACQHDVGLLAGDLGAGEFPDPQAALAMVRRLGGVQPAWLGLLAADHDVDVVPDRRQCSITESSVLASGGR